MPTKTIFGKGKDMTDVQNFLVKRNYVEDLDNVPIHDLPARMFTIAMGVVLKNFDFSFTKLQLLKDQSRYISVLGESEWFFDDQKRAINCFFPLIHDQKVEISIIFMDQQYTIPLEKNYLYFIPSWMTYKFINNDNGDLRINIGHFWFFSDTKIKNKDNNTWW